MGSAAVAAAAVAAVGPEPSAGRQDLRAGRGPGLPGDGQLAFDGGTGLVGAGVGRVGGVLRGPVDVVGGGAGRGRVGRGAADLAGVALGEGGGEFGGDAPQPTGLDVEPGLVGGVPVLAGIREPRLGGRRVPLQAVAAAGRGEAAAGGLQASGEVLGAGGGVRGGLDALGEGGPAGFPVGEPAGRVLEGVLVGPRLARQSGPFLGERGGAALGAAGRVESAELPAQPVFEGGEVLGPLVGEGGRQEGAGACAGRVRGGVLALGVLAQAERGRDTLGLQGPVEGGLVAVALGGAGGELLAAPQRVGVPGLAVGELLLGVEGLAGGGLSVLGGGEPYAA